MKKHYTIYQRDHYRVKDTWHTPGQLMYYGTKLSLDKPPVSEHDKLKVYEIEIEKEYLIYLINSSDSKEDVLSKMIDYLERKEKHETLLKELGVG